MAWFATEDNLQLLDKFHDLGVNPVYIQQQEGKLTGDNFVITGVLDSMGRDKTAEEIRLCGGTFQTAINKNTTYLVVGENTGKTKLEKANRLGVKILTEEQFLKMI